MIMDNYLVEKPQANMLEQIGLKKEVNRVLNVFTLDFSDNYPPTAFLRQGEMIVYQKQVAPPALAK